jgi:hypothetical protein
MQFYGLFTLPWPINIIERLAEAVRMRETGLHVCSTVDMEELELGRCRAMNLLRQLLLDGENTSGRERRISNERGKREESIAAELPFTCLL